MKILWLDTETTGLNPSENCIIEMAGMIILDKVCVEQFYYRCAPDPSYNKYISPEALKVNGHTLEEIRTWPDRFTAFRSLIELMDKHVDRYNKKDKLIPFEFHKHGRFFKMLQRGYAPELRRLMLNAQHLYDNLYITKFRR